MIDFTGPGPKRRMSERARRAWQARIFERMGLGSSIREIASRDGPTPRRIHQIVPEARQDRCFRDRLIDAMMTAEGFPALVRRARVMAEDGDAAALGFLLGARRAAQAPRSGRQTP